MLIEKRWWAGIRDGSITVMFRRWRRRQVTAGNVYRTAAGRIRVSDVTVVPPEKITKADARRAGYSSPDDVLADLRGEPSDPVYRLRLSYVDEPDPRDELAHDSALTDADVAAITGRLERLDRLSRNGSWTGPTLAIIRDNPGVRAPDLAATLGRETQPFKIDVRKLKNMGLTISLTVGYRISPRGAAYLEHLRGL
ncbi:hypothetical protein EV193_102254 [Herbihabitans rhizosphaerae]|uniref:ASCH domain-containing protein n=1 Tax=Herbihabitans rhizosphaerae TaxID=1872711 RepID=A0A4Q7L259_9PSEU|nr:ASCH domain-containing protein [Herbihabitans rhizosphaerae]RZS43275.1 hypothetical protein EV193_102254 [Herbihabitans rhizosphaerae]